MSRGRVQFLLEPLEVGRSVLSHTHHRRHMAWGIAKRRSSILGPHRGRCYGSILDLESSGGSSTLSPLTVLVAYQPVGPSVVRFHSIWRQRVTSTNIGII